MKTSKTLPISTVWLAAVALTVFASSFALAQSSGQQGVKPLTIEEIFTPGAITGRGPETIEWSADGTKLSFVQRDDKGEQGELGSAYTGSRNE